jgi:hypothetical protein
MMLSLRVLAAHQRTMHSRCDTAGRNKERACLGLPDATALEWSQGNHTPSPGAKLCQVGHAMRVRFSGVVSARPLGEIGRVSPLRHIVVR